MQKHKYFFTISLIIFIILLIFSGFFIWQEKIAQKINQKIGFWQNKIQNQIHNPNKNQDQAQRQEQPNTNSKPIFCCHRSYFTQKDFYENAYKTANFVPMLASSTLSFSSSTTSSLSSGSNNIITGLLVNHHLLAANFIAEAFLKVATTAPISVLLISPNHFNAGSGNVITSKGIWKTPYGELLPDEQLINQLTTLGLASVEESPFEQEHGITGIVAFIKKSLPNAKIVPIILKNKISPQEAINFADNISTVAKLNFLIVGSFDFSHYLTNRAANFHDLESLSVIKNFDFEKIYNLDTDSRPGLTVVLKFLQNKNAKKFTLLQNSNSAELIKQDILETTSYITGFFNSGTSENISVETMLFLGTANFATSSNIFSSFLPNSPLEYLQRFLFGQTKTILWTNFLPESQDKKLAKLNVQKINEDFFSFKINKKNIAILNCHNKNITNFEQQKLTGINTIICHHALFNQLAILKNIPVVYTKGNFWDDSLTNNQQQSLAIGLVAESNKLQIFLLPIGPDKNQLKLLINKEHDKILEEMALVSNVPSLIKKQIKQGKVVLIDQINN